MATSVSSAGPHDEDQESWHRFLRLDSYGLVLVLILVVLLLPAFTPDTHAWRVVVGHAAVAAVLLSLHSAAAPRWLFWPVVAVSVAVIAGLYLTPAESNWTAALAIVVGLLLLATALTVLNRIARHRRVTVRTLLGAIVVYFQIGYAFAFFYQAIDHFDPEAFRLESSPDRVEFTYYSFVTLATLGYGDIVPTSDTGRILAILETILGQIFLVAVLARIVSLLPRRADQNAPA